MRASFLPGRGGSVRERLKSLNAEPVSLAGKGAVLEKGIVYIARLIERLELRPNLSGAANPKSSTGRLDIFTRLIVDGAEAFDDVPLDYKGELWLEISPRSFSVRVKAGTKLSQVRFRSRNPSKGTGTRSPSTTPSFASGIGCPLVDGSSICARAGVEGRSGGLGGPSSAIARSRTATSSTSTAARLRRGFLGADPRPRRPAADPRSRRVLHSRVPREAADPARPRRRNAPIDPAIGEFRVHYAGFFDPGFGQGRTGARPRARSSKCAAATCRSCSKTASRSAAWSTKKSPARRTNSMAPAGLQLPAPGAEAVEALPQLRA